MASGELKPKLVNLQDAGIVLIALLLIAVVASVPAVLGVILSLAIRVGKVEGRSLVIWDFLMDRALVEAIKHNVVIPESHPRIRIDALGWMTKYSAIAKELHQLYDCMGRKLSDLELTLEIQRQFGKKILHDICIPNGLTQGECLIIALEVARGADDLETVASGGG